MILFFLHVFYQHMNKHSTFVKYLEILETQCLSHLSSAPFSEAIDVVSVMTFHWLTTVVAQRCHWKRVPWGPVSKAIFVLQPS